MRQRSENQMMGVILRTAEADANVRAVVMNGSRVDPAVSPDLFQDYDVVYFVRDVDQFKREIDVARTFGELMILQTPEDMGSPPPAGDGRYVYLMQFIDGNRIDLSVVPVETAARAGEDSLTVVLLDKDDLIGELPAPSEQSYLPAPPTSKAFDDCCNEFWWCAPYVAKGVWRDELTYAKHMMDTIVRAQLMKMLTWYAGIRTDYRKSAGKFGKRLQHQLEPELYGELQATFADADYGHMWRAMAAMRRLFRRTARSVAAHHSFHYPDREDELVSAFVERIRRLSKDAVAL